MAININPAYVLTDANQTIVKLVNSGTGSNGRTYTKVNAGWCFCVMFYDLDVIDWYGIILVSNVSANAVAYRANDRYGTYYSNTPASVNYNGETWYITYPDAYIQKDSGSVINWSYADAKGYYPNWMALQYDEDELTKFLDEIFSLCFTSPSGGAGSGYIGNSLVSNKKMVGYNVPTSSAESTKTESVNEASESPVSGKPKIGNGYAKIKLLRQAKTVTLKELLKTTDFTHIKDCRNSSIPTEYLGTDWLFMTGQTYGRLPSWDDANEIWYANEDHAHAQYVGGHAYAPIKPCYIHKAKFDLKFTTTYDGNPFAFYAMKINNNAMTDSGTLYPQTTQNVDITGYEVTFNQPIKADYFHVYCGGSIADIIYQISNMTLEVIEI